MPTASGVGSAVPNNDASSFGTAEPTPTARGGEGMGGRFRVSRPLWKTWRAPDAPRSPPDAPIEVVGPQRTETPGARPLTTVRRPARARFSTTGVRAQPSVGQRAEPVANAMMTETVVT